MLLGFLALGGTEFATGEAAVVGGLSLLYAGAGLTRYLGFKLPPVIKAISVNATAAVGALLGAGAIASHGPSLNLLMLTALFIIDLIQGMQQEDQHLDRVREPEYINPITSFFTSSWKVNGFNRRNFANG